MASLEKLRLLHWPARRGLEIVAGMNTALFLAVNSICRRASPVLNRSRPVKQGALVFFGAALGHTMAFLVSIWFLQKGLCVSRRGLSNQCDQIVSVG